MIFLFGIFPTAATVGFQPLGLGVVRHLLSALKTGTETLEPWNLHWGAKLASFYIIERSLEVKLPTICRDGKAEVGRVSEEKSRSEKIRDGDS